MTATDRAMREALRWGVRVELIPQTETRRVEHYPAPTVTGGITEGGIIRVRPDITPANLMHEIAHCITRDNPDDVNEVLSGMLAVEHEAARRGRWLRNWRDEMENYQITACRNCPGPRWTSIGDSLRVGGCCFRRELKTSQRKAVAAKLLTRDLRPTYDSSRAWWRSVPA